MGFIDKMMCFCRWLLCVLVMLFWFENIFVEEFIVRYFNKINLLIELKGEEKEIYGVCNVEIVFWIWY